jgi:carboxypeptidase Taq
MTVTAIKTAYEQLGQHIAEYNDLLNAISILKWDARTQMPSGGSETRGQQLSTLSRVAQEKFASDTTAALLDTAESEVANENMDAFPYRRRSVEQIRRYYNIVRRIPSELLGRKVALSTVAQQVWDAAKKNNDFASFAPYLKQMVEINRALADAIGYSDHPFDALVYEYEPTMTAAKLKALFAELRGQVLPLLRRIVAATESLPVNLWERTYPAEAQRAFGLEIAQKFGYDLTRGRLDISPHPFEVSFTRQDVRITTRYDQHYLPMALFGIFHETGHALYEQGVAPELTRSALTTDFLGQYAVGGTSYGAHESQSRLWENQIGRSREFWELHLPRLKEYFPEQLADVDADLFYRAINRVQPSLIRTEADEVTYNFHIMVRVEIIMGLLDGSLTVEQLPEVWNAQMKEYLGVEVPNDSKGVLQDVHFASGGFSSFPAYTIGNING